MPCRRHGSRFFSRGVCCRSLTRLTYRQLRLKEVEFSLLPIIQTCKHSGSYSPFISMYDLPLALLISRLQPQPEIAQEYPVRAAQPPEATLARSQPHYTYSNRLGGKHGALRPVSFGS
jgi:hypothetical protein